MLENSVILITGGTGSFGNAATNKFLEYKVREIRIFSRDEKKQEDMRHKYKDNRLKFIIGDIRDYDSIQSAMNGIDFVFSAAALKQVPSCEFYPIEAVKTNILGTANVLEAAIENRVKKVVVLSTDKAVYPINAMGMTKALMEKVMIAKSREIRDDRTLLCGTRYGNVIASRGSVIPLFIQQIKEKKPITVTDPNMTRFMMSLDQAINLVLFALEHCNQGDIFVQKAPSATVQDIAESLKDIFSSNSPIDIVGSRHGEKVHETLLSREEAARAEDMGSYFRIPADNRDLNYSKYLNEGNNKIDKAMEYTSENTTRLNRKELTDLLLSIDYVIDQLKN